MGKRAKMDLPMALVGGSIYILYIYTHIFFICIYIYIDTFYMPFGKELMPTAVREKHGKKNMI